MLKTYTLLFATVLLFSGCFFNKKKHKPQPITILNQDTNISKKALIVGVDNYIKDSRDLLGIKLDIQKMQKLFKSWGFEVEVLQQPLEFEKRLTSYSNLSKDDVFILYYTGHGSYTKDYSGDEKDGRDELIVLSDGAKNMFVLDDKIDHYLDKIEARKLVIFDSCNSGTSIRALNNTKTKVKYIPAPPFVSDKYLPMTFLTAKNPNSGASVFFAACRDNEQSLSSADGSLFTSTFVSKVNINKSASWIHQQTLKEIQKHFHPILSASSEDLKNIKLRDYLKLAN
jgi:hypothetical protein